MRTSPRFSNERERAQLVAYNEGDPAHQGAPSDLAQRAADSARRRRAGFEPDNDLLLVQSTGNRTKHLKRVVEIFTAKIEEIRLQIARRQQDWSAQEALETKRAQLQTTPQEDSQLEEFRVRRAAERNAAEANLQAILTLPDISAQARGWVESKVRDFVRRETILDDHIKFMETRR